MSSSRSRTSDGDMLAELDRDVERCRFATIGVWLAAIAGFQWPARKAVAA